MLNSSAEARRPRCELDEFERIHGGLPSERFMEAFVVDGVFDENFEFHTWSWTYATWQMVC